MTRSAAILEMIFLLSNSSLLLPRLTYALNTFSRRSRFVEYCRKGMKLGFWSVNTHFPSSFFAFAASAAAFTTSSGSPARSSFVVDDERDRVRLVEVVLPELHVQIAQLLVDLPQLRLVLVVQVRAAPHEVLVVVFEERLFLGVQTERVLRFVDFPDPREELRVQVDVVAVLRRQRLDDLRDLLDLLARVGPVQGVENPRYVVEPLAALLERHDRVREGRLPGIVRRSPRPRPFRPSSPPGRLGGNVRS